MLKDKTAVQNINGLTELSEYLHKIAREITDSSTKNTNQTIHFNYNDLRAVIKIVQEPHHLHIYYHDVLGRAMPNNIAKCLVQFQELLTNHALKPANPLNIEIIDVGRERLHQTQSNFFAGGEMQIDVSNDFSPPSFAKAALSIIDYINDSNRKKLNPGHEPAHMQNKLGLFGKSDTRVTSQETIVINNKNPGSRKK